MAFAFSGFEGFEKRLELHFFGDDPTILQLGLRKLSFDCIQQTLQAVQCTVVSAVGNSYLDAYVLSESSLFVYPTKIIIKTCGTTQLLKSITPLIFYAQTHLGLTLSLCRYTRGSFICHNPSPIPASNTKLPTWKQPSLQTCASEKPPLCPQNPPHTRGTCSPPRIFLITLTRLTAKTTLTPWKSA